MAAAWFTKENLLETGKISSCLRYFGFFNFIFEKESVQDPLEDDNSQDRHSLERVVNVLSQ